MKCLFLGYAKEHKAYRLLDANDGSIKISRSVTFAEHPVSKVLEKKENAIVDVIEDAEDVDAPAEEELLRAPPLQARQGPG